MEFILKNKKLVAVITALVGVAFIAFSSVASNSTVKKSKEFDQDEYITQLESRITDLVSTIDGAGKCKVMINIISGTESVYVKESKKSYDSSDERSEEQSEDSVVTMVDSSGNEYAVITKQLMPAIGGVTVACDGGNNTYVKSLVIDAVSTVLGIGSNKVCVIAKAN